jgi:hypothetical protein
MAYWAHCPPFLQLLSTHVQMFNDDIFKLRARLHVMGKFLPILPIYCQRKKDAGLNIDLMLNYVNF